MERPAMELPAGITHTSCVAEVSVVPAFDDFYRAHRGTVGRALAITLRDSDLASDAVDEAMARAYQHWAKVGVLDSPAGWVYRVGLNWSRSFLRRALRPAPIWVSGPTSTAAPSMADPAIDHAISQLSIDQRSVIVCRFLIGYSEAQTAAALHIRPGTVKSRLHRATAQLRVLLGHLEEPASTTTSTTEQDPS